MNAERAWYSKGVQSPYIGRLPSFPRDLGYLRDRLQSKPTPLLKTGEMLINLCSLSKMLSSRHIVASLASKTQFFPLHRHINTLALTAPPQLSLIQDNSTLKSLRSLPGYNIETYRNEDAPSKTKVWTVLQTTYRLTRKNIVGIGAAEDINAKIRGTFWKLEDANKLAGLMREKFRGVGNGIVMENGNYKESWGRDGGGIWYYDGEEMRWYSRKKNGLMRDVKVWGCDVEDSADGMVVD